MCVRVLSDCTYYTMCVRVCLGWCVCVNPFFFPTTNSEKKNRSASRLRTILRYPCRCVCDGALRYVCMLEQAWREGSRSGFEKIHINICIYIYICICVCAYKQIYVFVYVLIYTHAYIYIDIYIYMCIYI